MILQQWAKQCAIKGISQCWEDTLALETQGKTIAILKKQQPARGEVRERSEVKVPIAWERWGHQELVRWSRESPKWGETQLYDEKKGRVS